MEHGLNDRLFPPVRRRTCVLLREMIMRNCTLYCKCGGHEFRPRAACRVNGAMQSDMAELAEARILTLEQ